MSAGGLRQRAALLATLACAACAGTGPGRGDGAGALDAATGAADLTLTGDFALPIRDGGPCVEGTKGCYTVYAHGDHFLYKLDLANRDLVAVGPFKAPLVTDANGNMVEDVITDLAVAPDNTIYVVSRSKLYTADPKDGHVTLIGSVKSCGVMAVALSFSTDGTLYAADFNGAFCRIDLKTNPPTTVAIGSIGGGLALSGDIVVVGDGTMYGTAYKLADAPSGPTVSNNLLVKIDPQTGGAQVVGSTGYPRLYGAAFSLGKAFGFTHTGSGQVITIDPKTGQGTVYGTFKDPMTGQGIAFAGAGVNPNVEPTIP